METLPQARELGRALVRTGALLGLNVKASISDMNQPLGSTVGNALEVREALDVLSGRAPNLRFRDLCVYYTGETLAACGQVASVQDGKDVAEKVLESGKALAKFKEWVEAQGGDPFWQTDTLPVAAAIEPLKIDGAGGYVEQIDARAIGLAAIDLGGGRRRKDDEIETSVGIELLVGIGQRIEPGANLANIHARSREEAIAAGSMIGRAFTISNEPVPEPPLILDSF